MPRKFARRRSFRRRKSSRRFKRRRNINRRGRRGGKQNHPMFWFNQPAVEIETSAVDGDYAGFLTVAANTGAGIAPFLEAFDFYRILKWTVRITPYFTMNPARVTEQLDIGEIISYKEYNGGPTPGSALVAKGHGGCKITRGNREHFRTLRPAIQRILYDNEPVNPAAYEPAWGKWIRTSDQHCPHYGLGFFISSVNDMVVLKYRLQGKFLCQFMKRKSDLAVDDDTDPPQTDLPGAIPIDGQ